MTFINSLKNDNSVFSEMAYNSAMKAIEAVKFYMNDFSKEKAIEMTQIDYRLSDKIWSEIEASI